MNSCSVVILNWNGANYLRRFLPVLISNTTLPGVELVVADNASTDDSLTVLEKEFPAVRRIVLDTNYGFAGGYNKAIEQLNSEFVVLLNSDVEVSPGWLEPLLQYLDEHDDVAACQPKIRAFHQREQFEHAGAAGGFIDRLGYPFCRGRILSETEADVAQYDTVRDIFWATGACMVVRTAVYRSCGGLDDDFFAHMEEIDLCWRMQSRGYRITAVPSSVVFHVGGGTLASESPRKTYLNFRNNLLMLYKNLPDSELTRILLLRWVLDLVAALHLLVGGKPANAFSVLKAQYAFLRMKRDFTKRRQENLHQSLLFDLKGRYMYSILFDYYFKGCKTFSSLRF